MVCEQLIKRRHRKENIFIEDGVVFFSAVLGMGLGRMGKIEHGFFCIGLLGDFTIASL